MNGSRRCFASDDFLFPEGAIWIIISTVGSDQASESSMATRPHVAMEIAPQTSKAMPRGANPVISERWQATSLMPAGR